MPRPVIVPFLLAAFLAPASAQSVPDTIASDGVPEVPRELGGKLAKYQNIRVATFQDWLGDGREFLILTRFADVPQVHRVAFPGGDRSQLTFLPERIAAAHRRPGRKQFAFTSDEGGAENYQVSLFDTREGEARRLTDGKSRHIAPRWSSDGKFLAFSGNARNGKDMDLYVIEPDAQAPPRRFKDVPGNWAVSDWSPDGKKVAAVETISANETYVPVVDVLPGATETLTPRREGKETVAFGEVRWSKDGAALFWTTDLDSEFLRLARYDLATRETTVLSGAIPWDVDAFDLSEDGRTLALVANEDGVSRLHALDARDGAERTVPELPAGVLTGLTFRPQSNELGFTISSAKSPSDAYSCDLDTGKVERWTHSETGGLDVASFSEPELVRFPTFDGREIPAFVYRPGKKFEGPRPVLVEIHGGPESQFRPAFLGRADFLVNGLGVVVIHPNVRGSSGYGKSYLKLDNGEKREDSVKDIGALLEWIGKQPGLDASRVAVSGGSYGGYMALATLTHYGDRLRAGIDVVGISNFVTFLKNTQDYRRDLRRAEYGDERDPKMNALLTAISPLTNAGKIRNPLLVVQGKNDPRVPISEAEQIVAEVRKQGGPVWYVVGKNEGHGFAKKRNQDYDQAVRVLFLQTYLLGDAPNGR